MVNTARGTFDVTMQPGPAELDGAISRFELSKTFHGDLQGTGVGVMLSAGDPQAGAAGYVAIETVDGNLGGRQGSFALQQFGSLHGGSQTLHYEVVPGSGSGQLVSRVVSDFTVSFWDNRVCLLLRRLCCVPVMSRD